MRAHATGYACAVVHAYAFAVRHLHACGSCTRVPGVPAGMELSTRLGGCPWVSAVPGFPQAHSPRRRRSSWSGALTPADQIRAKIEEQQAALAKAAQSAAASGVDVLGGLQLQGIEDEGQGPAAPA